MEGPVALEGEAAECGPWPQARPWEEAVVIVHVVLLRLKPGLSADDILAFSQLLQRACRTIPSVESAFVGPRVGIDAGYPRQFGETTYDFGAILRFRDRDGLLDYLRHPLHSELGRRFWELCDRTTIFETEVVDVKANEPPENWLVSLQGLER